MKYNINNIFEYEELITSILVGGETVTDRFNHSFKVLRTSIFHHVDTGLVVGQHGEIIHISKLDFPLCVIP